MLTLGFIMFAGAALIAMSNFYLSFIRAPIYWRLGILKCSRTLSRCLHSVPVHW